MRARAREFIEEMIRGELDTMLARPRYGRSQIAGDEESAVVTGHRHGGRTRSLTGTFGPIEIAVPRARLNTDDGKTTEWKSKALRAYQRRTLAADALIASTYLAGTNTRRVRRALAALFGGAVGKDTVSRVWRKVKTDWDAWNARSLADEPIVRLILDGTVVRVRLDRKATSISLLVVIGVREDGQKVLLAIKSMGGESAEAWRAVLDDLIKRGLRRPEFLIVDGAPGLEKAIAAVWDGVPVQRCTVHKHRHVLAPIMPWRAYAGLTKIDAAATVEYLRSLPLISHKVPGPFGLDDKPAIFRMTICRQTMPNRTTDKDDGTTFMASTQVEWSNENYASSENSDAVRSRCFALRFLWIVERHFCELGLADV